MEAQEAIIIFIVGLIFGIGLAKWLINWAMSETINKLTEKAKELKDL